MEPDKESLSPKEKRQNEILGKGYDNALSIIHEARDESLKMRDIAKDKAVKIIVQAKCEAYEVLSPDDTDGVYISDDELFLKKDKKQLNGKRKMKLMVLTMELIIRTI